MEIFAQKIIIHRDTVTKISKTIWPWEQVIFEEMFRVVEVVGAVTKEIERLPAAEVEFDRLVRAYPPKGEDQSMSPVELAYGRGKVGIAALAKAIKASTKKPKSEDMAETDDDDDMEPAPQPRKKASKKKKPAKKKAPVEAAPETKPAEPITDPLG
jgi:hypothetical protein